MARSRLVHMALAGLVVLDHVMLLWLWLGGSIILYYHGTNPRSVSSSADQTIIYVFTLIWDVAIVGGLLFVQEALVYKLGLWRGVWGLVRTLMLALTLGGQFGDHSVLIVSAAASTALLVVCFLLLRRSGASLWRIGNLTDE